MSDINELAAALAKAQAEIQNPKFDVVDDRGTVWGRGLPFIDALALSKNLTPKRGKAPQFKLVPSSSTNLNQE